VTETILWLFAGVLLLAVLQSVIRVVLKGIADFFGAASSNASNRGGAPRAPKPTIPTAEALKKDPVCGTFLAPSSALHKTVHGETYYFCSAECRDKFKG
jgi:YHS domain-containing protein